MKGEEAISSIAQELKKLHASQASKKEIQANLFTLIIYAHEKERAQFLKETIQNIINKYPCRIVFIYADREALDTSLHAEATIIYSNSGGALVACDQIYIEAGSAYLDRVPSLILPHLLTDLPVYLLWGQDATSENEILPKLEKLADRLIFDAECTSNLQRFSQAILHKQKTLSIELMDINWALSGTWRDIITQTFYLPERLEQLAQSKHINIVYNCRKSNWVHVPEMQSIYLQAWLAARLKWVFSTMLIEGGERTFFYESKQGKVSIKLTSKSCPVTIPGGIVSVEVLSYQEYHFLIASAPSGTKVAINCSSPAMCELPCYLPLVDSSQGSAFMNEIFYSPPSQQYIEVLQLLNHTEPL